MTPNEYKTIKTGAPPMANLDINTSLPPIRVGICPGCTHVILVETAEKIVRYCCHSETVEYYAKVTGVSVFRNKMLPAEAEAMAAQFDAVTDD